MSFLVRNVDAKSFKCTCAQFGKCFGVFWHMFKSQLAKFVTRPSGNPASINAMSPWMIYSMRSEIAADVGQSFVCMCSLTK